LKFACRLASQATKFLEKTDRELYERLITDIDKRDSAYD